MKLMKYTPLLIPSKFKLKVLIPATVFIWNSLIFSPIIFVILRIDLLLFSHVKSNVKLLFAGFG